LTYEASPVSKLQTQKQLFARFHSLIIKQQCHRQSCWSTRCPKPGTHVGEKGETDMKHSKQTLAEEVVF